MLQETYKQPPWEENWTLERAKMRVDYFTSGIATLSFKVVNEKETIGYVFARKDIIAEKIFSI